MTGVATTYGSRLKEHIAYSRRPDFNHRFIFFLIGLLCLMELPFLLIATAVSVAYGEANMLQAWVVSTAAFGVSGLLMWWIGRRAQEQEIGHREGIVTIGLSWPVIGLLGMLPLALGEPSTSIADAYFETISGLTSTGLTTYSDVEQLPHSLLLWRSLLQWQGGVGVIVFVVALIPLLGEGAAWVFATETSDLTHDRFLPRIGPMAKWIMGIYMLLTLLCFALLAIGPMTPFDAICHALSTISTGGFSTKNDAILHWHSPYIAGVVTAFMLIGATNFTLLYRAVSRRQLTPISSDTEFGGYVSIFVVLSVVATGWLLSGGYMDGIGSAMGSATFAVASLLSTTGYSYGDYWAWGGVMSFIAIAAMFISGSSGSTAGGLKVIRLQILGLAVSNHIRNILHPHAVIPIRINHHALSSDAIMRVMVFFFAYLGTIIVTTILLSLHSYGLGESMALAISCVSNTGGVLGSFAQHDSIHLIPDYLKVYLTVVMVLGRLEIFTLLVLFHRNFWKR